MLKYAVSHSFVQRLFFCRDDKISLKVKKETFWHAKLVNTRSSETLSPRYKMVTCLTHGYSVGRKRGWELDAGGGGWWIKTYRGGEGPNIETKILKWFTSNSARGTKSLIISDNLRSSRFLSASAHFRALCLQAPSTLALWKERTVSKAKSLNHAFTLKSVFQSLCVFFSLYLGQTVWIDHTNIYFSPLTQGYQAI